MRQLRHLLRAKAVLCPGLLIRFFREGEQEHDEWCYQDGLRDYLVDALQGAAMLPEDRGGFYTDKTTMRPPSGPSPGCRMAVRRSPRAMST